MAIVKTQQQKTEEEIERRVYLVRSEIWKQLQKHGDVTALSKLSRVTKVTISKAINHGEGSLKILRICDAFYLQRIKEHGTKENQRPTGESADGECGGCTSCGNCFTSRYTS